MKKILAFILAALTVFSTVGFAAPTVEVTENSEEITETGGGIKISLADKAALSEEEIDYNAPIYGLKFFSDDFEGYEDDYAILDQTGTSSFVTWKAVTYSNSFLSAVVKNTNGNKYVKLNLKNWGSQHTFDAVFDQESITWPDKAKFTIMTDFSTESNGGTFAAIPEKNVIWYVDATSRANYTMNTDGYTDLGNGWTRSVSSFWTPQSGTAYGDGKSIYRFGVSIERTAYAANDIFYIDNMAVYYKPYLDSALSYTVGQNGKNLVISAPEGIEAGAAKAIEAAPEKYFGRYSDVITGAQVTDSAIILTLDVSARPDDKVISFKIPELVNAAGTNTYAETYYDIDFNTLEKGARLWSLDFEDVTGISAGKEYTRGNVKITLNANAANNATIITDPDTGNKYLSIGLVGGGNYLHNFLIFTDYRTAKGKYTFMADEYIPGTSTEIAQLNAYAMYNSGTNPNTDPNVSLSAFKTKDEWHTRSDTTNFPYVTTQKDYSENISGFLFTPVRASGAAKTDAALNTVYYDNFRIYAMPTETVDYDYDINGSTVTVTASEGIDAVTANAFSVYPALFFGNGATKAVYTEDNGVGTIEITVTDACTSITLPKLVNKAATKAYNAAEVTIERDVADYYSVLYGIKDWFYTAEADSSAAVDDDEVTYVNVKASSKASNIVNTPSSDRIYTIFEKVYESTEQTVVLRNGNARMDSSVCIDPVGTDIKVSANQWTEYKYVLQLTDKIAESIKSINVYHDSRDFKLAYNGLYYKPVAEALEPIVKPADAKTVIVTYPNGIYEDTAKALEAYYEKYFGDNVESLTVSGKTVTIKLAANAEEFEIPSLVSEDGTKTSAAVTIFADMKPATDAESTDYSDIYNGMRFHASVTDAQRKSAVEYGWIVARKVTIGDSELTFALNNDNGKTFVTGVSYGDNGNIDKIFHNDVENGKFIFTGVIKGIPEGMEDDVIVARPYIKYLDSGVVFYGNVMTSTLAEVMPTQGE